jgi:hypothetical protein
MLPVLGMNKIWPVVLMGVGDVIIVGIVRMLELNVLQVKLSLKVTY